jgi:hypothetical protein
MEDVYSTSHDLKKNARLTVIVTGLVLQAILFASWFIYPHALQVSLTIAFAHGPIDIPSRDQGALNYASFLQTENFIFVVICLILLARYIARKRGYPSLRALYKEWARV